MRAVAVFAALLMSFSMAGAQSRGAPKLQTLGFPREVSLGEDTMATCFVRKNSQGPYTMRWFKDGAQVEDTDRVKTFQKATSTSLAIDGIRVEDVANYTCVVKNSEGSDSLTLPLFVTAPPTIRSFSFPPEIALGEEVIVVCAIKKGSSTGESYSISWRKDGRPVLQSERVSTSAHSKGSSTLVIASLRPEDVGNYTCVARNSVGADTFTAPLVVNGNARL
ncbi:hypothetical protein V5799_008404 [Amblyomma americanum]|uniref:Ig-like domain-containing protein n=1 Tax=Amblyomma americanum TaxID=6943 RepID=A0AAQ4FES3_AMBAM